MSKEQIKLREYNNLEIDVFERIAEKQNVDLSSPGIPLAMVEAYAKQINELINSGERNPLEIAQKVLSKNESRFI